MAQEKNVAQNPKISTQSEPNLKIGTYVSSVMSFEYANVPYVSSGSNNLVEETGEFFRLKFFYKKDFEETFDIKS